MRTDVSKCCFIGMLKLSLLGIDQPGGAVFGSLFGGAFMVSRGRRTSCLVCRKSES